METSTRCEATAQYPRIERRNAVWDMESYLKWKEHYTYEKLKTYTAHHAVQPCLREEGGRDETQQEVCYTFSFRHVDGSESYYDAF